MKLQKIMIEINFVNKYSADMLVDLLVRKYKKIKLEPKNNGRYLLKGMDKHRQHFINELINERILTLNYTNGDETEYILSGVINM